MDIEQRRKNLDKLLNHLLEKQYHSEFRIINGLNQHPEGVTLDEYIKKILEEV